MKKPVIDEQYGKANNLNCQGKATVDNEEQNIGESEY